MACATLHGAAVNTENPIMRCSSAQPNGFPALARIFPQLLCQVNILKIFRTRNLIFELSAGESEDGEPLFVGRAQHEGTVTVGKVQPSHGVCYISYAGQELGFADYEVLVA